MEVLKINLFGSYGLIAVLFLASAWIYPSSSFAGGWGLFSGLFKGYGFVVSFALMLWFNTWGIK